MKWPRHYAAEIIAEDDRAKRRQMLADVPKKYRAWVETLVRMAWERKR